MELKPCPFCGGEAVLIKRSACVGHGDYCNEFFVTCKKCHARGDVFDDYLCELHEKLAREATEAWNRRADNA